MISSSCLIGKCWSILENPNFVHYQDIQDSKCFYFLLLLRWLLHFYALCIVSEKLCGLPSWSIDVDSWKCPNDILVIHLSSLISVGISVERDQYIMQYILYVPREIVREKMYPVYAAINNDQHKPNTLECPKRISFVLKLLS